jgi:hypothetical protein
MSWTERDGEGEVLGRATSTRRATKILGRETVGGLHVEYEVLQEFGNRTSVRWVEFLGRDEALSVISALASAWATAAYSRFPTSQWQM